MWSRSCFVTVFFGVWLTLLASGCGRYGPPLPPEAFAPARVRAFRGEAGVDSLRIVWEAPTRDIRGGDLAYLEGYEIYRTDESGLQKLLEIRRDEHLPKLLALRERAIKERTPVRKAVLPKDETTFDFVDDTVKKGETYRYEVVPFSEYGGRGETHPPLVVDFRGERSQISFEAAQALDQF